ncbi:sulfite exporter TauE/SafE family protein [Inmirania thermothiophila]|uniref:Probable membrane transporter protein n=1 Tax=Inmirania thermothiophila TaxID=1750597 RepID=A0A3N1Y524_9GAMM|nr:sulfite exporter TauE/SafE family protein [Inmirania thermothiophila]ROR32377.1 hypothetical protein EDC57_1576 [Inmirania thermothiophila]
MPPLLPETPWPLAAAILALAGLVHGTLGVGFPLTATPLLAVFTDVRAAILLTLLPTVVVNVLSIARGGRWSESLGRHWPLAVLIPAGTVLGTALLARVDPAPFRLLLAAVIGLYLLNRRERHPAFAWVRRHRLAAYGLFGLAAGFLAGTVNVMVPLLVILGLELEMPPRVMVQVFNLCFLTGKLTQIGTFATLGALTPALLGAAAPLALVAAAALLVGMRLRERIAVETYRTLLRRLLAVLAVVLVAQFLLERG